ncbi:sodium:solute symporter family protein [Rubrivirga sp. IMCC43871]|uniref:sodium:solute symporter family protein n=1 Tax=Rubrivirga sp. IMCC43871 TaxID=3391575 RepID=UPI00398FF80A
MQLAAIDWWVIALYGVVILAIGLYFTKRAGEGTTAYFLAGRKLPWWVLGTSMVATTFSTDTPNLVTDIVRTNGVSGNWVWWAFAITGMLTVFFYAKLWRRSEVVTDLEFYELRYSGKPAAFLRGFRAVYLGVFFNTMILATVTLAAIKIGGVLLGVSPVQVVLVAGTITVLYSATSGLWGVVATDLLLFVLAMVGAIAAAVYAVGHPAVGGLAALLDNPALDGKTGFLPDFSDWDTALAVFIVPVAVQWWSTWYPGSEPGGGGYNAQRMLAAKSEDDSLKAILWFNVAHYGLRPWPWVLVALASMVVYPTLESIQTAFPDLDPSILGHDLAYPAMLVFLPSGLLGLVVASLAAAYMSTVSTHLNWGASYVVQDVYRRFAVRGATEAHYVTVARVTTVGLTVLMGVVALGLSNALQAFDILLQIGAGTGLVFLLRWFWWRINAWSEISAMVISFAVAVWLTGGLWGLSWASPDWDSSTSLVMAVLITTVGWVAVTLVTPPADRETLQRFVRKIRPQGPGWASVRASMEIGDEGAGDGSIPAAALAWFLGCVAVYAALFGTGYLIYGEYGVGIAVLALALVASIGVMRLFPHVGVGDDA